MLKKILPDVLLIAGAGSVSFGAWLAYNPAGFIVAGALAMYAAIKIVSAA